LFNHWQKFSLPDVLTKATDQGFGEVDVLLLDSIYQPFWLSSVRYKRCIVRLSDFNAGFKGFGAGARRSEMAALAAADLVVTASRDLCSWAKANGAREAVYIPNGVDIERFNGDPMPPVEYRSMTGKIAVFVGDMNDWVDIELIADCARALPEVNFVLIGPGIDRGTADVLPNNVHALGVRPYCEVPAYLMHADLGLIPFHQRRCASLVKHINPLKLYEYFAAGIPVVSTRWSEIEGLSSPARLCGSSEEFVTAVQQSLREPVEKDLLYDYARRSSWPSRLDRLFSWLDGHG
jgi:glycosyltransferase involved in cell wall biosynthesis